MTASTDLDLPPITCPSSLIASCPPLLGFFPEQSLICLVYRPGSTQPVIARLDLVDEEHASQCAANLAEALARTRGSRVALVLWVQVADDCDRAALPGLALVEHLERSLGDVGLTVELAVGTNTRVWWPLLCGAEECCSGAARPLDAEVAGRVRVQYAVAGYAPLAARTELAKRLTPDPGRVDRARRFLADSGPGSRSLAHRRRQVDQLWRVLRPAAPVAGAGVGECLPERHVEVARGSKPRWPSAPPGGRTVGVSSPESAVRSLGDVGIRDALLVRIANDETSCRACWQDSIAALVDVVRASPSGHVAPGATLLSLVAWLSGDGALASVAVDRALEDDPRYRLAVLAYQLFSSGIDPRTWRGMTTDLTEEDCLRKTARTVSGTRR